MVLPLEQYALIGDTHTVALVGIDGSIDWLCLPRFDADPCFAALLGTPDHGRWVIAPAGTVTATSRRYQGDSLVLQTEFTTADGTVRVIDCMPIAGDRADLVRRVEGVSGTVEVHTELSLRFDFGRTEPWIRAEGDRMVAIAGPNTIFVDGPCGTSGRGGTLSSTFEVSAGDVVDFQLSWVGIDGVPPVLDAGEIIDKTRAWWFEWAVRSTYHGPHEAVVTRSLITLKALTYAPSGGVVAAPTTSLPEQLGGVRNWDYRYCWIRDATFTLLALLDAGYTEEAAAWRGWLLRAVAGRPEQMQIMYGINGESRLTEVEIGWLPGYENSAPVRAGNAAAEQFQLDVYGELMDALHHGRVRGLDPSDDTWRVQLELLEFLETAWQQPDEGIWEVRGPRRHFTHSKVMAWVAFDRAVRAVEEFGREGPVERWRTIRQQIHDDVTRHGFDADRNTFTQYYGSRQLDASLLLIPSVGFLPADDPRVRGTVAAIEKELLHDGLVLRYGHDAATSSVDGLPPGEGTFLACTFWLADAHILAGDLDRGREIFHRLCGVANDVGLLAEEYDPRLGRMIGNFPQALSHLQLVATAFNLAEQGGPSHERGDGHRRRHGYRHQHQRRQLPDQLSEQLPD